jgi:hypothetical protein
MGRKDIIQIAIIAILITLLLIIVVLLSPLWVMAGMINPKLFSPLSRFVMQKMTRQFMRGMMSSRRQ